MHGVYQSAYRQLHSTETALLHEVNLLCMLWWPPVVTPVETSRVVVISYAWVHRLFQGNKTSVMQETTNSKIVTLLTIDRLPIFTIESVHTDIFSSKNKYSDCIVIAKTFLDLAKGIMVLLFMAGCSYWLRKAKNKHNSFEMTRQDKISRPQCGIWHDWPPPPTSYIRIVIWHPRKCFGMVPILFNWSHSNSSH